MSDKADVLIVGSGPSAAYAALACQDAGVDFIVMSNRPPRVEQAGAFFLHWLPERLSAKPFPVQVWGVGDKAGYLTKQWGPEFAGIDSSFPTSPRIERWYSSLVLNQVWDGLPVHLGAVAEGQMWSLAQSQYRVVFHTFPTKASGATRKLAMFPCLTRQQGELADSGTNQIIYNGHLGEEHVRTTVAWGRLSVEFPRLTSTETLRDYRRSFRGDPDAVQLRDIHPDTPPVKPEEWLAPNVVPIGRFATWDRRKLSHDSYATVIATLKGELA